MSEFFCIDCGKAIEQVVPGVISGWIRTDGNRGITEAVPGGIIYGTRLGYVCNDCSIWEKQRKERGNEEI